MTDDFEKIKQMYRSSYQEHGVSSSSMLMPKGRHEARFQILREVIDQFDQPSLLDYGCGLGFLWQFLVHEKIDVNYVGVDIVEEFISSCRERFGSRALFERVDPNSPITGKYDVVYASGVFNLKSSDNNEASLNYVRDRLLELFGVAERALVVDFLSPYVDFTQSGAQHISPPTVLEWFVPQVSRRWAVRHDYLPFEYSVVIYKNDEVDRPSNTFFPH